MRVIFPFFTLVSWRSSVSRLHINLYHIYLARFRFDSLFDERARSLCAFFRVMLCCIFFLRTFWDRLLSTTGRFQGVKSKHWNNKNYLFLYHILRHSAHPIESSVLYELTKNFIAARTHSKRAPLCESPESQSMQFFFALFICALVHACRQRNLFLTTSIDKLPTKCARFKEHFSASDETKRKKKKLNQIRMKIRFRMIAFILTNVILDLLFGNPYVFFWTFVIFKGFLARFLFFFTRMIYKCRVWCLCLIVLFTWSIVLRMANAQTYCSHSQQCCSSRNFNNKNFGEKRNVADATIQKVLQKNRSQLSFKNVW